MTAYRTSQVDRTEVFYHVIAPDYPGFGQSPRLAGTTMPEAELHFLDTGHFPAATHSDEIADLIAGFLETHVAEEQLA